MAGGNYEGCAVCDRSKLMYVGEIDLPDNAHLICTDCLTRLQNAEESRARIANAAMAGAEAIDSVPQWNGMKAVTAYQNFDHIWRTTLLAEDMTYMRGVVGLPEPGSSS